MSEYILIAREKGLATLTLNRPDKRNALNGKMVHEIIHALALLRDDNNVRVLIIKGNGEHFCAGADILWMQQVASASYETNYDDAQALADLMYQLYIYPKPTIALAQGATLGGGLGILAACDIALVGKSASFSFSEVKIGITPSIVSPYIISAIGERAAHYYFLTGARFDADEAHRIGLAHQIVDDNKLVQAGIETANLLLKNSPNALTVAKQLIRHVAREKISSELAQKTAEHLSHLRTTREAQEGLLAFMEKRTPQWTLSETED